MAAPTHLDWDMGSRAAELVDWSAAAEIGKRVGGSGVRLPAVERAAIREDFARLVLESESLIADFTGLEVGESRPRAWVMSRGEWVKANLRGLQQMLEPLAARYLERHPSRAKIRRKALGAEIGALLGYVSRKVLGQYDVFLPPDDRGLLYFVGPNVAEVELRSGLSARDFRLWIALHEVTHQVQFDGAPWLRGYVSGLADTYLATVELDPRELLRRLKRAAEEARRGEEWRGMGLLFLVMTPEQRDLFGRMQSVMSLLEGHASFVMNSIGATHLPDLPRLKRALERRRRVGGLEGWFRRAIGFENKIRQYSAGERFVKAAVEAAGMDGFNQVWRREENVPAPEELGDPGRWLARVVGG